MKAIGCLAGALLTLTASIESAPAQAPKSGIERMYVLYCGDIALTDMGRFSPGYSGPGALSSTCYLFKHTQGWLLWDTGLGDAIASMPEGQKSNAGVWHVKKTLTAQLAEIGVKPSDIRYLALSHSHGDHVGNVNLFPQATLVVQKAEYDWPDPSGTPRFPKDMKATKAEGDHDLFGDGSVLLISTPGHSPGHQCLLSSCPRPARSCSRATPFTPRPTGTTSAPRSRTLTLRSRLRPWIAWRPCSRSTMLRSGSGTSRPKWPSTNMRRPIMSEDQT
jgi:N-acyl homoserine lactone hydrolase